MTVTATYDAGLGRVVLAVTGLNVATAAVLVTRFDTAVLTNGVTVRGGDIDPADDSAFTLWDYEFEPNVPLTYRVESFDGGGAPLDTFTDAITVDLAAVWLKSIARPFLNRTVTVIDFGDVTRPARGGVFEVIGRRLPVAVTETRGSRRYELVLRAADAAEAEALELFASFGDVVLVHVPDGCPVPRSMYAFVGDVTSRRAGRHDSQVRYFSLPLTEVSAPAPEIVGYTITCAGVVATWATCGDLLADPDVPTCLALLSYVADPEDEVVG